MRQLLAIPAVYKLFSRIVGADRERSAFVKEYVRPRPGDRVLDIGCGPADILEYLPAEVEYSGFDVNPAYIEFARERYGERGRFKCQRVSDAKEIAEQPHAFDIVLAVGILHHLDRDEAIDMFRVAERALKPPGRLVTLDGCYVEGQSAVARYLLSRDRGEFVRTADKYLALAKTVFDDVTVSIRHDLLHIPYTHIALECKR